MPPELSVVIPAYRSAATLSGCLAALRAQNHPSFEVIVVDSSPDEEGARIVREHFPEVHLERSHQRLLPHAARNRAVELAAGRVLVFADPDVYPRSDWLSKLAAAHHRYGGLITGALVCHGRRWLDIGIHLCKFSKWLPAGDARLVDMGPTAGLLCPRTVYDEVGGFRDSLLLGDAVFSWEVARRGHPIWLTSDAVAEHHHRSSFASFLRERLTRGVQYGALRLLWERPGRARTVALLVISVLPLRLATNLAHCARHAWGSHQLGSLIATLPVVIAGFWASLLGEAWGYTRGLMRTVRRKPGSAREAATP